MEVTVSGLTTLNVHNRVMEAHKNELGNVTIQLRNMVAEIARVLVPKLTSNDVTHSRAPFMVDTASGLVSSLARVPVVEVCWLDDEIAPILLLRTVDGIAAIWV